MKKNIVMIGIMLVLALVLIRGTKIQSVEEYYLTHMEDIQEDSETVMYCEKAIRHLIF